LGIIGTLALATLGFFSWWHPSNTLTSQTGPAARRPSAHPEGADLVGEMPVEPASKGLPCDESGLTNPRSMPNGSRITPDVSARGYGLLEVENGTSEDAVLSLHDPAASETVREVYVQARRSVRFEGIPKGSYELSYAHGLDWDGGEVTFHCGDAGYSEFEREFVFTEERDQEGVKYTTITVTLHPVIGGNIRTEPISREKFLKNHHRTTSLPR
jgi:hypothetical protein